MQSQKAEIQFSNLILLTWNGSEKEKVFFHNHYFVFAQNKQVQY